MAIADIQYLMNTNSENTANLKIAEGWTLLLLEPVIEDGEHFVRYHLGRTTPMVAQLQASGSLGAVQMITRDGLDRDCE